MSKSKVKTTVQFGDGPEVEVDLDGSNSRAELNRLADNLGKILDEIADLQEDAKAIRQAAKSNGFTVKTLNQIVKEKRRGAEYQADQLTLDLDLDTYRAAYGLPRSLEEAQGRVADQVGNLPEDA